MSTVKKGQVFLAFFFKKKHLLFLRKFYKYHTFYEIQSEVNNSIFFNKIYPLILIIQKTQILTSKKVNKLNQKNRNAEFRKRHPILLDQSKLAALRHHRNASCSRGQAKFQVKKNDETRELSVPFLNHMYKLISDSKLPEERRYRAIQVNMKITLQLLRDVCLSVKGSFVPKLMKSKCLKYVNQLAKHPPLENNGSKNYKKIWGDLRDQFFAQEFYKMGLRIVYEMNLKFGTDKNGKETTFKEIYEVRNL